MPTPQKDKNDTCMDRTASEYKMNAFSPDDCTACVPYTVRMDSFDTILPESAQDSLAEAFSAEFIEASPRTVLKIFHSVRPDRSSMQ